MMDITITTSLANCGPVVFDNAQLALAFMRTLAHTLTPSAFVDLVHTLVPSPDAVADARATMVACFGAPA